jgi:hypothetical protein
LNPLSPNIEFNKKAVSIALPFIRLVKIPRMRRQERLAPLGEEYLGRWTEVGFGSPMLAQYFPVTAARAQNPIVMLKA